MAISAPGAECLTRTQEIQREFQARLRDKGGLPQTNTARDLGITAPLNGALTKTAVTPVQSADSAAAGKASTSSQSLDIIV